MLVSLAATLLTVVQATAPLRPTPSATAFVNVSVIPMDSERVLTGQTVVVDGDRINAIGPVETTAIPAGAVRVDGQGKFLMPGLGDMHAHLTTWNVPLPSPGDYAGAMAAFVANGVTTIRIMAGEPWHLNLRAQIADGTLLGPTLYVSSPQVHEIESPEAAARLVDEYKAAGYDLIKTYDNQNAFLTREIVDSFLAAAHRAHMPFGGHTPYFKGLGLAEWLKRGPPATIDHLNQFSKYFVPMGAAGTEEAMHQPLDESLLAQIGAAVKAAGTWHVPTLTILNSESVRGKLGFSAEQHGVYLKWLGQIFKGLHTAEVGFLLGSDGGLVNGQPDVATLEPGISIHRELELLVAAGLTPYEALATGTRNVAAYLGTLDQTGTIEVGKRADLVLASGNPLENIRNTAHPAGVMIRGRWLPRESLKALLTELKVPDTWW